MTDLIVYSALGAAALALGVAALYARQVPRSSAGNETMVAIANAIRLGANTFLRREYTWMAGFVALLAVLIAVLTPWGRAMGIGRLRFRRAALSGGRPRRDADRHRRQYPDSRSGSKWRRRGGAARSHSVGER